MKTTFLILTFWTISLVSFSQLVDGELVKEGRKLAVPSDFTMYESTSGDVFYRIAVDRTGKVTSAKLIGDKSVKVSIPLDVRIYNYLMDLKFEPGNHFPKFHDCEVKITLKPKSASDLK
ncbi:MAG: hypothetical protein M9916_04530 [Crocinitomicaceae bacterium]|nr:hypothetical protein [Crocinitomicaceae bacterium]